MPMTTKATGSRNPGPVAIPGIEGRYALVGRSRAGGQLPIQLSEITLQLASPKQWEVQTLNGNLDLVDRNSQGHIVGFTGFQAPRNGLFYID